MATVEDVLAAMERVVRTATSGPWRSEQKRTSHSVCVNADGATRCIATVPGIASGPWQAANGPKNAAYIARFDPPTLTALLAVVRAASSIDSIQIMDGNLIGDWVGIPKASFNKIMDALDALTRPPQGGGG